ncbi:hypothetical protein ELH21_10765 [Rhizobium leguminosarum]|uniref:hypothetical protein n=1 Tax=Rhizobium leguminosarum TaxID=384 RepID=UPI00103173C2|nr:hypothetical protein [Rhizobium leguminosarum]TBD04833.1 hypothetical protein ELH21_10765 [Rhizobium leguminosarum]
MDQPDDDAATTMRLDASKSLLFLPDAHVRCVDKLAVWLNEFENTVIEQAQNGIETIGKTLEGPGNLVGAELTPDVFYEVEHVLAVDFIADFMSMYDALTVPSDIARQSTISEEDNLVSEAVQMGLRALDNVFDFGLLELVDGLDRVNDLKAILQARSKVIDVLALLAVGIKVCDCGWLVLDLDNRTACHQKKDTSQFVGTAEADGAIGPGVDDVTTSVRFRTPWWLSRPGGSLMPRPKPGIVRDSIVVIEANGYELTCRCVVPERLVICCRLVIDVIVDAVLAFDHVAKNPLGSHHIPVPDTAVPPINKDGVIGSLESAMDGYDRTIREGGRVGIGALRYVIFVDNRRGGGFGK